MIFDHVVLATHANQALRILGDEATEMERRLLSVFETRKNVAILHSDPTVSLSALPCH
jgi:predicted NAD/FAD-binding protein